MTPGAGVPSVGRRRGRNPRLELSLDKIGGSEEQNRKTSFHILFFSRLELSLDKIGCGSEEQNRKTSFHILFFSHLELSLL